jgi:type II secretory pathway pseudopilin PulG
MTIPGLAADTGGTSLVEALVATLVFAVAVAAVVPLVVGSVRATRVAREHGAAAWMAWQKLEELRSLSDAGLGPSPAAALEEDTPGYVDYLDDNGGPARTSGVFVRRWAIEPAGADGDRLMRLAVAVHHVSAAGVTVTLATLRARRLP